MFGLWNLDRHVLNLGWRGLATSCCPGDVEFRCEAAVSHKCLLLCQLEPIKENKQYMRRFVEEAIKGKTLTLMYAGTGGDNIGYDGPRVADSKSKQRQHRGSDKREAAFGAVEQQAPARYKEAICRKRENRVKDQVMPFEITLLFVSRDKKGSRVTYSEDTRKANAKGGREPRVVRDDQKLGDD